jgi:hypothetical protein
MPGLDIARKLAVPLLRAANKAVSRYSGFAVVEVKSRLAADGRRLDINGLGAKYTVAGLPDFLFTTDLSLDGGFTVVHGLNCYRGLTLSPRKNGPWVARIADTFSGRPASTAAIELAKQLARLGALYEDTDAINGRRRDFR